MTNLVLKNPYPGFEKGLNKPFGASDKEYFYGRQDDINNIKLKLRQNKLILLRSLPRAGKTSLIEAGLIPTLESKGYLTQYSNVWKILRIDCKGDPIKNVAEAIANAAYLFKNKMQPNLEEIYYSQFNIKDTALKNHLEENAVLKKINLLIVIDDFYHLFESVSNKDKSIKFLKMIYHISLSKSLSVYMLISVNNNDLREPLLLKHPEMLKKFDSCIYQLHNLDAKDLKKAILEPAKKEDVVIEEDVCQTIMDEIFHQPDQLPKLQRYLNRTWWEFKNHKNKESIINLKLFNLANGTSSKKIVEEISNYENPNYNQIVNIDEKIIHVNDFQNNTASTYQDIFDNFDVSHQNCCMMTIGILANLQNKQISFEDISSITNSNRQTITDLLYSFNKIFSQKNEHLILNFSKETLINEWSITKEWINRENENKDQYLFICNATVRHYIEEEPLENVMTKVDLVNALLWRNKFKPKEVWANLYNSQYEMAMDFLDKAKSELNIDEKLKSEEIVNKSNIEKPNYINLNKNKQDMAREANPIKKIVLKKK